MFNVAQNEMTATKHRYMDKKKVKKKKKKKRKDKKIAFRIRFSNFEQLFNYQIKRA